jgi:hypothetical protein
MGKNSAKQKKPMMHHFAGQNSNSIPMKICKFSNNFSFKTIFFKVDRFTGVPAVRLFGGS